MTKNTAVQLIWKKSVEVYLFHLILKLKASHLQADIYAFEFCPIFFKPPNLVLHFLNEPFSAVLNI